MGILKAGRPTKRTHEHIEEQLKLLEEEKRLNVKMPEREYDKLKRVCFEKKISISAYVRELIMKSIDSR